MSVGWERVRRWSGSCSTAKVPHMIAHGQRMTPLVKRPGTTTSSPSASTMERRELRRWSSAIFKSSTRQGIAQSGVAWAGVV